MSDESKKLAAELFLPGGGINVHAIAVRAKRNEEKKRENKRRDQEAIEVPVREVKELK